MICSGLLTTTFKCPHAQDSTQPNPSESISFTCNTPHFLCLLLPLCQIIRNCLKGSHDRGVNSHAHVTSLDAQPYTYSPHTAYSTACHQTSDPYRQSNKVVSSFVHASRLLCRWRSGCWSGRWLLGSIVCLSSDEKPSLASSIEDFVK